MWMIWLHCNSYASWALAEYPTKAAAMPCFRHVRDALSHLPPTSDVVAIALRAAREHRARPGHAAPP
jgi:hypothetical protein